MLSTVLTKTVATIRKTKRPDFDPFREQTAEDLENEKRQQEIDDAIASRVKELRREQVGRPVDDRLSDNECKEQAERDVYDAIRRTERAEQFTRVRADFFSAYTRNEHVVRPWFAGAAYAGVGETASILGGSGALAGAGPTLVAAGGAAGVSWYVWKRIKQLPEKYWTRFRTGVGAGCATCLALPLAPWDWHGGLLFGGAAALVGASAKYWADHAPSYPPQGGYDVDTEAVSTESATSAATSDDDVPADAADIIADWNGYVRDTKILPGAGLTLTQPFKYGFIFTVKLVRGQQRFDTLQKAIPDIAYALNMPQTAIQVDPNADPYKPLAPTLTITTCSPDTTFTGPVIVREDRSVYIELGPYTDGRGVVRYEILSDQLTDEELARGEVPRGSAVGGFILGDKGSGKTRLQEAIALGALKLGIETWYLDPQGGASSPTLRNHAAWPLMGLDSPDGTRAFGNVEDLAQALEGVVAVRQDENSALDYTGFQHTPERPMILVIIDECHLAFAQYGHRFGEIDRIARKLGIAFLGASQAPTQDVFGGSITLRNGMAGANGFVLKYNGSNARLAFGGLDDEIARGCQRLRPNRTLGYATASTRPHAVFQNRYTPDLEPFFTQVQPPTLDELATIGAGEAYARRYETAQQNTAAVNDRLAQYRNGTLKPGQKPKNTSGRTSTSANGASVSYMFPGTQSQQPAQPQEQEVTRESLTTRQEQILDMLTDTQLTAKQLATELGKTTRTISSDLKVLREHTFVLIVDENEGTYTARTNL